MKVAIMQPYFFPYIGYFQLINAVDEFVIYDEAQYTKNDWRNRNKINTKNGSMWITIPVRIETLNQKIYETTICDHRWIKKHKATLQTVYAKAKYFEETKNFIFELYDSVVGLQNLSEINIIFIKEICRFLGILTKISTTSDYILNSGKNERLVDLCIQAKATHYLSGPSAKSYINEDLFSKKAVQVEWMNYDGYKEYDQIHPTFAHNVSILDLIFNEGTNARSYLKY